MNIKYSVILGFMGQITDRFSKYHQPRGLADKLALAATVEGAQAVEPIFPADFQDIDYAGFRQLLAQHNLKVSSINVNLKGEAKFHRGALTSTDPGIRAEAVRYMKMGMDWAAELGANLITVCPLADGHDYPFEIDYGQAWNWMVDCFSEAAEYRPDVKLSVEYKQSEPRARVIVPNAGIVLYLCQQIGLENVGMTLDTGHALYITETPAQMIRLAADANRLFLLHINDNYRNWDWDLIPGTVNYWDWLETLLVLDQTGYTGWLVSDVFPARTDPVETLASSYRAIQYAEKFLDKFGRDKLQKLISQRDVITTFDELQAAILGDTLS